MNQYSVILEKLSQAPDSQIDALICQKLLFLSKSNEVCSTDLLDILDDCAYSSLESDFAIQAMDMLWKQMLENEGVSVQEALAQQEPKRQLKYN